MVLISVQLLEMELVPFRKKKRRKGGGKKREKVEKTPFFCGKQTKDVFFPCLKISYGELHVWHLFSGHSELTELYV